MDKKINAFKINPSLYLRNYLKMSKLGSMLRRRRWNKGLLSEAAAEKMLDKYLKRTVSEQEKKVIIADMMNMAKKYRFAFDEYFLLELENLTEEERLEFIPDLERVDIIEAINIPKNQPYFDDKYLTYKVFGDNFKRDVCCVLGEKTKHDFYEFTERQSRFIVKPFDGSCGKGIKILSAEDFDSKDKMFAQLMSDYPKGFIAEEVIKQHPDLMKLYPKSVNTVRITTLRMDDRVEIIHPFLRIGRGDMIVDNGGAGGIICLIDPETGKLIATRDEAGERYSVHPDTGEDIIGFQIPRWEEAVEFAKELAYVLPSNRYTGWDLAVTENGWVLVEANVRGQFIGWQITSLKGFRKEIESLLKELGYKKSFLKGI